MKMMPNDHTQYRMSNQSTNHFLHAPTSKFKLRELRTYLVVFQICSSQYTCNAKSSISQFTCFYVVRPYL